MEMNQLNVYEDTQATITSGKTIIEESIDQCVFPKRLNVKESQCIRIELSGGMTINLGNFESLRVDARLSVPCEPTPEALEETFTQASEWIGNKISVLKEQAQASR